MKYVASHKLMKQQGSVNCLIQPFELPWHKEMPDMDSIQSCNVSRGKGLYYVSSVNSGVVED